MSDAEQVREWIKAGKQVGTSTSWKVGSDVCQSSVAIQKWKGGYAVHVYEILESKMASEDFQRDETLMLGSLEAAETFVGTTRAAFTELRPCKGQKIFNPEFAE